MTTYWSIQPEWVGETAFIVGGGPSVKSIDLSKLKGRRVIAVNTSYEAVPFADFVIFSDFRWWDHHQSKIDKFQGRIVCASRSPNDRRLLMVRRKVPPGLDQSNDCLPVQFTTTTGAMGMAVKLGAKKLVLIGIDGAVDPEGNLYHHRPHPWDVIKGWQDRHRGDLEKMVGPLRRMGIEVVLATPSVYEDIWPRVDLKKLLGEADEANHDTRSVGNGGQHLRSAVLKKTGGDEGGLPRYAVAGDLRGLAGEVRPQAATAEDSDEERRSSAGDEVDSGTAREDRD